MEDQDYEQTGRDLLHNYGAFKELRGLLGVTLNRMSVITGVNSKTMEGWEAAGQTSTVRAGTAIKIGKIYQEVLRWVAELDQEGVRLTQLMPWHDVARSFGVAPDSYRLKQKCQEGALTCRDLGSLGVYVPRVEVEALKKAGF
jgi:hypothetical protein